MIKFIASVFVCWWLMLGVPTFWFDRILTRKHRLKITELDGSSYVVAADGFDWTVVSFSPAPTLKRPVSDIRQRLRKMTGLSGL